MKRVILVALLALCTAAGAQTTPAKKELVAKILQLQQPGLELLARNLAGQSVAPLMQRAGNVLQARIPADKREAVAREMQGDIKKYGDEVVPLLRDRAIRLAPTTVGALLEEKFTEDELKQLLAIFESPVNRKYAQLSGDMNKILVEKLVAETKATIDPKIAALDQALAGRLGIQPAPAGTPGTATAPGTAAPGARPPARAASN